VIHDSSHAQLTARGISWYQTLSAQEKHGDITEYLKRNEFDKAYLKKSSKGNIKRKKKQAWYKVTPLAYGGAKNA